MALGSTSGIWKSGNEDTTISRNNSYLGIGFNLCVCVCTGYFNASLSSLTRLWIKGRGHSKKEQRYNIVKQLEKW